MAGEVHEQTDRRVEPRQTSGGFKAFKTPPNDTAHHAAVLLLHPCLIVLAIRTAAFATIVGQVAPMRSLSDGAGGVTP
jgi:hypothetical protein